jgi:Asp-tRNA(Asn)/Glu-tRNA(Gln) amidotransferase C subunit
MTTKEQRAAQIVRQIQSLQNSRQYADEVEAPRITKQINALLKQLDEMEEADLDDDPTPHPQPSS